MADDSFDIYASGRERIRESVKWLYGVLTGIAAVLLATVSWTALPDLLAGEPGEDTKKAWMAAAALFFCVVVGVGATLWALSSRPFGLTHLKGYWSKIKKYEELFAGDVPARFEDFKALMTSDATTFQRVLSFGSYLDMSWRARTAQLVAAAASLAGAIALGVLLQAIAAAEDPKSTQKMRIVLSPTSIEALAKALRD